MIITTVWMIIHFGAMNPVPPLADKESCERVLTALDSGHNTKCVEVKVWMQKS